MCDASIGNTQREDFIYCEGTNIAKLKHALTHALQNLHRPIIFELNQQISLHHSPCEFSTIDTIYAELDMLCCMSSSSSKHLSIVVVSWTWPPLYCIVCEVNMFLFVWGDDTKRVEASHFHQSKTFTRTVLASRSASIPHTESRRNIQFAIIRIRRIHLSAHCPTSYSIYNDDRKINFQNSYSGCVPQ